eukprot:COSAG02_NODE_5511_length_4270_cov_25.261158_1_plen_52_part_10
MIVALEWLITVHSFSVELYGHDSGIILYMINGSRARGLYGTVDLKDIACDTD